MHLKIPNILLIEDDADLAQLIAGYLRKNGIFVTICTDGWKGQEMILEHQPDMVILDIMLPGKDGMMICKDVRPDYMNPIMMLTAKTDVIDQILGLEIGADDYVCKPVEPRLLLARVQSLLRRANPKPSKGMPKILHFDRLHINRAKRMVMLEGEPLSLSIPEYELLLLLVSQPGTILSRDIISKSLRNMEYDGVDRTIDILVTQLRSKLGDNAHDPRFIKTVRNQGYMFMG